MWSPYVEIGLRYELRKDSSYNGPTSPPCGFVDSRQAATGGCLWAMRTKMVRTGLRPLLTGIRLCPQPHRDNSIKAKNLFLWRLGAPDPRYLDMYWSDPALRTP